MIQVTGTGNSNIEFRAEVAYTVKPAITKEFKKGGVRFYACGTRIFFADLYDKMFSPLKLTVKTGRFKGENPDRRRNYLKGEKSY